MTFMVRDMDVTCETCGVVEEPPEKGRSQVRILTRGANVRDPLGGYEDVKGCAASAGTQSEALTERFNSLPVHHTSEKTEIGGNGGSNPPSGASSGLGATTRAVVVKARGSAVPRNQSGARAGSNRLRPATALFTDEAIRSLSGCEEGATPALIGIGD